MILLTADARKPPIARNTIQLLYLDPPRNIKNNEGHWNDALPPYEYQRFVHQSLAQLYPLMAPSSWLVVCLSSANRYIFETKLRTMPLQFVQEIIWYYDFGLYTRRHFVKSHDTILLYRKGHPEFYWQAVAIPSQRMIVNDKRADWRGRTPGSVWSFSRVPGNSKQRAELKDLHSRSCQPEQLVQRFVLALTLPHHLVLDPFLGTGTTAKVCRDLGRRFIGFDICEHYVKEIPARLEYWKKEFIK